jgi:hypothetical protein
MLKKIIITSFLFITLVLITKASFSQTLYFCEGVDRDGYPINQSTTFYIPSGGGYFYFLMRLPYEVQCYSIKYELYRVDTYDYTESYSTTIYHDDLSLNWVWFWKKVTFYKPGYYHVYAVDCNGYTLTSSYVTVDWN